MPFKSEAQRRKFASLVTQGKMSQKTFDEWENATKDQLPERVGEKKNKVPKSTDDLRDLYKRRFGK